jgi:XTP/dITP diphosphohydrolase
MSLPILVIATRNRKKLEEMKYLLKGLKLDLKCLADFKKAPYPKEDGKSFLENAAKKALCIGKFTYGFVLAEDSGLEIDALNGAPGIYSSRFSGFSKDDFKNNLKILRLLGATPQNKRKARYQCAVVISRGNKIIFKTQSACEGFIGYEFKGNFGFGYDPLFVIPEYNKTFAELGPKIKHAISHRAKAFVKTKKFLSNQL